MFIALFVNIGAYLSAAFLLFGLFVQYEEQTVKHFMRKRERGW